MTDKPEDPLDRKGMFFVVNWDARTLGQRHDKLRGAVEEYKKLLKEHAEKEYHFGVCELTYPSGDNDLALYVQIRRIIKF